MATFIDGIAASENIDSSGERLSIAGMDISSLDKTGTFNWEHKKDLPAQTVGKILKAKKIFDESECEDDRQAFYWQKCQVPFVYVMGELFDEYCDSSKHLAGLFRYDHDKQNQNEHDVVGFSIEGAKLAKDGMNITRSIARKCTITESPCNKTAIAQLIPADGQRDDGDSIFKTENSGQIQMFKKEPIAFAKDERDMHKHAEMLGLPPMEKALTSRAGAMLPPAPAPMAIPAKTNNPGTLLGSTKSGQSIFSHAMVNQYSGLSAADHNEAANMHYNAAQGAQTPQLGQHHLKQVKMHMQAAGSAEKRASLFPEARAKLAATPRPPQQQVIRKATDAGSAMSAAPGTQTQGAALAKEDKLNQPLFNKVAGAKTTPGIKAGMGRSNMGQKVREGKMDRAKEIAAKTLKTMSKTEWSDRAADEFAKWEQKDAFRTFMNTRCPHMTKGEIDALGQTIALKKSLDSEKALANLVKKKK